jgi:hypothetical protein
MIEADRSNKVVLHAKSSAETSIGPFGNEYMIVLTMSTDQEKIVHIKDFLDSAFNRDFIRRLESHLSGNPQ